jgi:DNA primase
VNIVDLIGEQVSLTRRGRTFKGLCPFHDDHNPSMDVDPERQRYRCWSCGAAGDIFDFVMNRERIGFREALESLAQRARITLPQDRARSNEPSKEGLYEVMRWAEQEFHRCLLDSELGKPAREYAASRSLNDESIKAFRLGYAPNEWDWLIQRARARRITHDQLEKCGLVRRKSEGQGVYDWFRGRLMFPIRDARRRVIAFGGRILPEFEAKVPNKYDNSPQTSMFTKSEHLYGLDQARDAIAKSKRAVVVEGYTDCIMAHQKGLTHVVGTLGTALASSHVAILKRHADRIVLVYDGDDPGQKAADRALALFLSSEVDLRVFSLPDNLDPCDFLLQRGPEEFERGLDSAVDALDFKLRRASQLYDLSSIDGRRQALDFVLVAVAAVPVLTTGTAPITREIVLDRLGHRLGLPPDAVRKRLRELRERQTKTRDRRVEDTENASQTNASPWANESTVERELLEVLLADPTRIEEASKAIEVKEITTPGFRRILEVCIETIRDGQVVDLDGLRQRLEDRELACRASILAETGREKGAFGRRLADVLAKLQSRKSEAEDQSQDATRGDGQDSGDAKERRAQARFHKKKLSDQSKAQRHAMSDSP